MAFILHIDLRSGEVAEKLVGNDTHTLLDVVEFHQEELGVSVHNGLSFRVHWLK